jgi:hypothetical protein
MTPDEFRNAFIKSRGLTINDSPIPQIPVQSVPITPTDPVRTDIIPSPGGPATIPGVHRLYPAGPPPVVPPELPPEGPAQVVPPITPGAAYARPKAFPTGDAAPVPFNPVREPGPAGVSLNSTPVAPGWAGTVGLPGSPEEAKGFDKGQKYNEALAGLETIAKGLKPKPAGDSGANTITPMSVQPNAPSQVSGELMAQLLQHARRPRGLTLTGQ